MQTPAPVFPGSPRFSPKAGTAENPSYMTVDLPGERLRAEIVEVCHENVCRVLLRGPVMRRAEHGKQAGDIIAVRRIQGPLQQMWVPVSDREVREQIELELAGRAVEEERRQEASAQPPSVPEPVEKPKLARKPRAKKPGKTAKKILPRKKTAPKKIARKT